MKKYLLILSVFFLFLESTVLTDAPTRKEFRQENKIEHNPSKTRDSTHQAIHSQAKSQPSRVHQNISRTPSMSRAKSWSSTPHQTQSSNLRQSEAIKGRTIQPPKTGTAPRQALNLQKSTDLNQLKTQFERRSGNQVDNIRGALKQEMQRRENTGNRVRNDFNAKHPNKDWFKGDFWKNHNYRGSRFDHGHRNWWRRSSWADLNDWVGWPYYSSPVYYEWGYPIDITTEEYPEYRYLPEGGGQEQSLAIQDEDDWLPLGVFAVLTDENSPPLMYFQLVLNRDGTIGGSYYNQSTGLLYPIEGVADQETQSAIWRIANTEVPIFQTGLYNLTFPQTSVDVHFSDENIQEWLMIRL